MEDDINKYIEGSVIISRDDDAFIVEEIILTPAGREALSLDIIKKPAISDGLCEGCEHPN